MNQSQLNAWFVTSVLLNTLLYTQPIAAQVIPDITLPVGERSQVTGNPDFQIDGGARRGGNLFHSFDQFSIPTGGSASFNNTADVQNIFSRITGGSASNIDGLIRANGTANLFLLNPNGILFGPNASLNIGGSFVGTTADAIGFPNGEVFSSDATQPLPGQLLNVNPNALFFNQLVAQSIINQSTANNEIGLQVPAGQSLLLVGGNVELEGGRIVSPGSQVELGAVAGQGMVGLSGTAGNWRLSFSDSGARADVTLSNDAWIDVFAAGGGSITVTARNLAVNQGSSLRVGINDGSGFTGAQAGDLRLDATGTINLADGARIRNDVRPGGVGNAGNINITTGSLVVTGNAFLISRTSGQGDTGSVTINARDRVSFEDSSGIFNVVDSTGVGNARGVIITAETLSLRSNAQLTSGMRGRGNTGNVNINVRDTVSFDDSVIFNTVDQSGVGNAGDINITTGSLALRWSDLQAITYGQGNAGNVNINARDTVSFNDSNVLNILELTGVGNAGDINITTGSLALSEDSQLVAITDGRGNAGSVNINARDTVSFDVSAVLNTVSQTGVGSTGGINITTGSFALSQGSQLLASTSGQGNAGNITINARDQVSVDGASSDGVIGSAIFARVNLGGVGQGGNLTITTGSLSLTNGGAVNTATDGQGNAGSVTIQARDSVEIRGRASTNTDIRSGVFTTATAGSVGNGGDVTITTGSFSVSDEGRIITDVRSQGNAGDIQIQASDAVSFNRGDAVSTLSQGAVGRGGNINITGRSLSLLNGAQLSTSTRGRGDAGNVTINTRDTVTLTGSDRTSPSAITTQVETGAVGDGGQINITTGSVSLTRGAQLVTTTLSRGRAGNISINARDRVTISGTDSNYGDRTPPAFDEATVIDVGPASGLFANTEANSSGAGGAIALTTDSLSVLDGGRLVTSTAGRGNAGDITVNSSNLSLSGASSGLFAQTSTTANAGNLTIQPQGNGQTVRVQLQEGAQISASTSNSGRGGRLTITAPDSITLTGNGSIVSAETSGGGTGGNLNLRTGTLNIQEQAEVTVSSSGAGSAGNLFVEADRIFLDNGGRIRADTSGGGGNIDLRSPLILLRNGSNITTNATGVDIPGGDIDIDTGFLIAVPNENSNISANSQDFRGGNVSINAIALYGIQPSTAPTPLSDITATGATTALPGTIDVTTGVIDPTSGLVALPTDLVDASGLIAQSCPADAGNSFVVTGRGGLPPTPAQELDDAAEWQDRSIITVAQVGQGETEVSNLETQRSGESDSTSTTQVATSTTPSILEANGWQTTPDGEVILVAHISNPTRQSLSNHLITCQGKP
jgi:filamentous hemagglutinin family protein